MNTKKAMRTAAPPEVCRAAGLPEGTTLGAVMDHMLKKIAGLKACGERR